MPFLSLDRSDAASIYRKCSFLFCVRNDFAPGIRLGLVGGPMLVLVQRSPIYTIHYTVAVALSGDFRYAELNAH